MDIQLKKNWLTILITVYNEANYIQNVIEEINEIMKKTEYNYQIVIINDGSTDWSQTLEDNIKKNKNVILYNLTNNVGKGGAYDSIFSKINTEYTIAIDADLEYPAYEIPRIAKALINDEADHVIGSRYGFGRQRPEQYFITYLTNVILNTIFYISSGIKFHDFLSGLFGCKTIFIHNIKLKEKRFGYVPEFYWKLIHQKVKFLEIPIDYRFRSYKQGKKIKWYEFFTHISSTFKYRKP